MAAPCLADVIEPTSIDFFTAPTQREATEPADIDPGVTAADPGSSSAGEGTVEVEKTGDTEVIHERYPNRAVKVERHVVQDASGNYVNHGLWTMFDEQGRVIGRGEYRYGERHGPWTRWHFNHTSEMLSHPPYKLFQQPFVSQATFENGRLHGTWVIYDARDHKASEFSLENGERQGKWIWYYPSGQKMREVDFVGGYVDGKWQEWGPNKNVTMNETYINGRRLAKKTEYHSAKSPKDEGTYLFARESFKSDFDWWNGSITTKATGKEGKDQRHGQYTSWHKNGQKEMEGRYVNDLPVGKFTWWYDNGQKAIEGQYDAGQQMGVWDWWHQNGQKATHGEFVKGVETGKWTWWREDGKVANSARITEKPGSTAVAGEVIPSVPVTVAPPVPGQKPAAKPSRTARQASVPGKLPATQRR
ncbi:MAG: hypothetical protein HYX69_07675 [Planctomycetia bacterium]|nr:hypothetical protein [Planctomycetia bacterium]